MTMSRKKLPRVLVLANNSLSDNNSNGRTLAGFLGGFDKNDIAEIYITGETPSPTVCDRFFRITDMDMVNVVKHHKKSVGGVVENHADSASIPTSTRKGRKSVAKLIARDLLWSTDLWWTDELRQWISEFNPEILLLFAGESLFTYRIAEKITREYTLNILKKEINGNNKKAVLITLIILVITMIVLFILEHANRNKKKKEMIKKIKEMNKKKEKLKKETKKESKKDVKVKKEEEEIEII